LLELPEPEPVRAATVSLARELLRADGSALWADGTGDGWRIVRSSGVTDSFATRVISSYRGAAVTSAGAASYLATAVPIADVDTHPMVQDLAAAYRDEGIRSMLVCPMRIHGNRMGTLVFYFRSPRVFGEIDIETGQALANVASAALKTAALLDEQRRQRADAEIARHRATFLADAAATLSRSLDYEQTLADVARLAVPEIADWCAVDIVADDGSIQRLAVAHVDPEKVKLARELQERYPSNPSSDEGVHAVIRTGRPIVMESIPPELVEARARDEEHRRILADLNLNSFMCVPLVSARGVLGAMTFVLSGPARHYTHADLALAEDVAARASLALDNAFAYSRVQQANRLKDEFLATLSHELRTPLNAVLGYAHMLMMNVLRGERQRGALEVLTRNAKALAEIIDDLLDVSRISSGKLQLEVKPLSIRDVVEGAIATMKPAIDAKGISLRFDADAKLPAVSGDSDRLQQVVRNILSNAVKFVSSGGHITVRLVDEGEGVAIEVSDDGPGIDPAFLPYVFERFRQADSRFSREHGGLGLGLAIVKELTELHGGTVSAASAGIGQGATFRVVLPARRDVASVHSTDAPVRRQSRQELSGVRVLAVDDDPDALELVRTILESAGATVVTHQTGDRALDTLRRTPFDVVLCDLGMPAMDGLELIRRIRALPPPSSNVPAAALTAYARSEDRSTVMTRGFQMHLAKPINPLELVAAVSDLANRDVQGHV
jgi:signal transduction histidine kinase/CheY-like chemotaxis protein